MPRAGSETFEKPHVLVVEGLDDFYVVLGLLSAMSIDSVQIVCSDGVERLAAHLKVFVKTPGWSNVRRLGILLDSDGDPGGRLTSIRAALKAANLAVPPAPDQSFGQAPEVLYSTLPGPESKGRLESLILQSLPIDSLPCIQQFMACVGVADDGVSGRHEKACVHAYIASSTNPGLKVGEAVKAGVIDSLSPAFEPIRALLRGLVT
jgi:hypothetical protein